MANDNRNETDQELLVSYLDGELESSDAAAVETRLTTDETFRRKLNELRETWDLLDELPHPTVDESFTRTTVEMVAVNESAVQESNLAHRSRRHLAWLLLMGLCVAVSFVTVRGVQRQRDEQLLTDLPLIERLDEYQLAANLQFVQALLDTGLFSGDAAESETDPAESPDGLTRRQELAILPVEKKQRLRDNQRRFERLAAAEQQRIRELHAAIGHQPNHPELLAALEDYRQWTNELNPKQRAEISETSGTVEDQVAMIVSTFERHGNQELRKWGLSFDDTHTIRNWFFQSVNEHREKIWAILEPKQPLPPRERFFFTFIGRYIHQEEARSKVTAALPVNRLLEDLSSNARAKFQGQPDDPARHRLLSQWVEASSKPPWPPKKSANELMSMIPDMPQEMQAKVEELPKAEALAVVRRWYESRWLSRLGRGRFRGRNSDRGRHRGDSGRYSRRDEDDFRSRPRGSDKKTQRTADR